MQSHALLAMNIREHPINLFAQLKEGANERLEKTSQLVVGFFAGCVAGAAAVSLLGDWAWSLPVVLAAGAVLR